jgi:excinuclease ABC subunit C
MEAVQSFDSQQKIIDANKTTDSDIYGFAEKSGDMEVSVLFVRGGRVSSYRKWSFVKPQHSPSELLTEVITQYYIQNLIPEEILLPFEIQDQSSIEDYLKGREKKVRLSVPKKGRKKKMVDMACKNASLSLKQSMEKRGQAENLLKGLQEKLHLRHFPGRIECFDISHFQGSSTVASQVVFVNGEPEKESYRKYHIKEVSGPDDFKSMYEVLSRRFTSKNQKELPNLLVVDGGQGQLSQALLVLQELSLEGAFDVVGLAKSRVQDSAQERNLERSDERVFLPNRKNPVHLKSGDPSCHLMERVRDEAHRFAITFHRSQQKKRLLKSGLDDIEGIGPKKKKALLKVFGSVRGISEASLEELQEVKGVDEVMARKLKESLKLTP